ncbi:MAG: phage tail assembly protein [Chloroflexi bacterium]|jgi:predicted RND superfamily exporter protein|nr:hypothetical protein [Anaerolineaceae bacterium]NMB88206.1 phage tail assembly protein [Chloroflexota bacterium]
MTIQTEFEFELPIGYVDKEGTLHKHGTMRLATAMDEITPLNDMRVQANEAYLAIALITRVVTGLGTLKHITSNVIENLFAADMAYLQAFYQQINENASTQRVVTCPHCQQELKIDLASLGEE